jgi:serine/threonine-protein kinase
VLGDRYCLERELGRGASGVVWAARDERTARPVALKVLLSQTPAALGRFRREARVLLSLDHPGIVRVTDVITDGAAITAIAMERLRGETLRARLIRGAPLGAPECARIIGGVAAAVAFAHGQGVLHRDLKPENVFLCEPGSRVVVLDFGLARWLEAEGSAPRTGSIVTEHGSKLGTLPYMAPEQLTDAGTADEATDVWSIGVLLYECLTGFRPFEAEAESDLVQRILLDAVAPVSFVAPHVPPALAGLAARLLSRDRAERTGSLPGAIEILGAHAAGAG